MRFTNYLFLMCIALSLSLPAQNTIQWRNDRTGIYNETGLLKSWPVNGPELLWHYDGLGDGFSSVAIDSNKIYITGMTGSTGYIYVLDLNGKLLDKKEYGTEWDRSYNGSRGTVTVNEGKLYVFTGTGNLICMNQNTLDIIWKKNVETDFDGKNIQWGMNESPLIVNEKVILSPGGKEHNIVALNKYDGSIIWSCPGEGDLSAYCSPLYLSNQQIPQIVTMMASNILGIDISNGKKLWSFKYENIRKIHPNTPVYDGKDMLLFTAGYDKGAIMLRLTNGGRSVEKVWEQEKLQSHHGGMIKIDNYAYAGGEEVNKFWYCVDWNTGVIKYQDNTFFVGAVIADGDNMMYCYSENGEMALVKATSEKFDLISKYKITLGTDQHWAHPVIYQGVLYVRHGSTLMAYKIK